MSSNDRIIELIQRINEEPLMKAKHLCHYTSIDGLKGILGGDSIKLWFTRSDCLNDTSEGKEVEELFYKARTEWCEENYKQSAFCDLLNSFKIPKERHLVSYDSQNSTLKMESVKYDAYICSFSKDDDSLDMWRYYSKGRGGYALVFGKTLFDEFNNAGIININHNYINLKTYGIIYNEKVKLEIIKEKITLCNELFNEAFKNKYETNDFIHGQLASVINRYKYCFKNQCFESEKEIRAVIYLPQENLDKNNSLKIEYRPSNGIMVPYIELKIENKSKMNNVRISPFINEENATKVTSEYIKSLGYKASVDQSELPVRLI